MNSGILFILIILLNIILGTIIRLLDIDLGIYMNYILFLNAISLFYFILPHKSLME